MRRSLVTALSLLFLSAGSVSVQAPVLAQAATQSRGVTLSVGIPDEVGMSSAILQSGVQLYRDAVDAGDLVGLCCW